MQAYLILFILVATASIFSVVAKREAHVAWFFTVPLLCLFSGTRVEIGWDYEAYDFVYSHARTLSLTHFLSEYSVLNQGDFEPGFLFFVWCVAALSLDPQLVIVSSIVAISYLAYRRNFGGGIALFSIAYLFYGYFHTFSIVRQGLAAAIFLAGISLPALYGLLVLAVSTTVHASILPIAIMLRGLMVFPLRPLLVFSLIFSWIFSFIAGLSGVIEFFATLLGYERWLVLLDFTSATHKVGISFVLLELSVVSLMYIFLRNYSKSVCLAGCIVAARLIFYGLFNDISIVWERFNSGLDMFYACAVAVILREYAMRWANGKTFNFQLYITAFLIILCCVVFFRYYRLIGSESRGEGEMSHYERFVDYETYLF